MVAQSLESNPALVTKEEPSAAACISNFRWRSERTPAMLCEPYAHEANPCETNPDQPYFVKAPICPAKRARNLRVMTLTRVAASWRTRMELSLLGLA